IDPDLKPFTTTGVDQTDPDVVGVVDDALHKVFKRWPQHGYSPLSSEALASSPGVSALASAGASVASSALTSSVLADSSFFSEDFLAFEADFLADFLASASSAALVGSMPASLSAP